MSDLIWYVWLTAVLASFGVIQYLRHRQHGTRGTFSYTVMWRLLFTDHAEILKGRAPRKPRVQVQLHKVSGVGLRHITRMVPNP